jgi:hypothetical protein
METGQLGSLGIDPAYSGGVLFLEENSNKKKLSKYSKRKKEIKKE